MMKYKIKFLPCLHHHLFPYFHDPNFTHTYIQYVSSSPAQLVSFSLTSQSILLPLFPPSPSSYLYLHPRPFPNLHLHNAISPLSLTPYYLHYTSVSYTSLPFLIPSLTQPTCISLVAYLFFPSMYSYSPIYSFHMFIFSLLNFFLLKN